MTAEQISTAKDIGVIVGIVLIGIRNEFRSKAVMNEHKVTQEAVKETQDAVQVVQKTVDGPLSAALKTAAGALAEVARLNGTDANIIAAIAARKQSDDHELQAKEVTQFKADHHMGGK